MIVQLKCTSLGCVYGFEGAALLVTGNLTEREKMQRYEWTIEKITRLPFFFILRATNSSRSLERRERCVGDWAINWAFPGKTPDVPAVLNTSPTQRTKVTRNPPDSCRSKTYVQPASLGSRMPWSLFSVGPTDFLIPHFCRRARSLDRARRELYDTDEMRPDLMTI